MLNLFTIGMGLFACSMLFALVLLLKNKDQFSIAVLADLLFYSMIAFYVVASLVMDNQISYEIVLLASLIGGVLPTMSMARIISKGRR